jgi:hypothetical protein
MIGLTVRVINMDINKKNLMILGLAGGIFIFFLGLATNILLGPSTETYRLPSQLSAMIRLSGMGLIVISMVVGGFFVEKLDKDTKSLLLIFGIVLLLLNIFVLSYGSY